MPPLDVAEGGQAFMRHAIKRFGTPENYKVTWLVGELDGVFCYVTPDGVVMTKEPKWP